MILCWALWASRVRRVVDIGLTEIQEFSFFVELFSRALLVFAGVIGLPKTNAILHDGGCQVGSSAADKVVLPHPKQPSFQV